MPEPRFSLIPTEIMQLLSDLDRRYHAVLMVLGAHTSQPRKRSDGTREPGRQCFMGQAKLAAEAGIARQRWNTLIRELVKLGVVVDGGRGKRRTKTIRWPDHIDVEAVRRRLCVRKRGQVDVSANVDSNCPQTWTVTVRKRGHVCVRICGQA